MRVRKTQIPESVKIVAQNIKNLIKEKGLKTSEVAVKAEIDIETFRRYVGGPNGPSIIMGTDKLIKIALALELDDYNKLFMEDKTDIIKEEFKIGDKVRLISGSPDMTIKQFTWDKLREIPYTHKVDCNWFEGKKLKTNTFNTLELIRVDD